MLYTCTLKVKKDIFRKSYIVNDEFENIVNSSTSDENWLVQPGSENKYIK